MKQFLASQKIFHLFFIFSHLLTRVILIKPKFDILEMIKTGNVWTKINQLLVTFKNKRKHPDNK